MSENSFFWRVFAKRTLICFTTMMLLFLSCVLRVAVTATSEYDEELWQRNCYKMKIGSLRGTVYDCNMVPITNSKTKIIAAVSPTEKAITGISSVLEGEELRKVLESLKKGDPAVCEVPEDIKCDGIVTTKIYENSGNETPAIHLIGYTDSENKGVSGIEQAYDSLLYSDKEVRVYFESDGKGNILEGAEAVIENDTNVVATGVVATIDVNIQNIAEKAALNIESGAVVVAEAQSGKIRAMVSRPFYDCENIGQYLNDESSPLLNRAINAYNVGSVFKPCVSIAGIENGKSEFYYNCTGSHKIIDRYFKCHKADGHGFMNLKSALANSCNTFFYNFAFKIGGEAIYNTASALNFGKSLKLCDGLYTASGSLPEKTSLQNLATLANFSIGQGKLTLSPVSILTLYCAIATDGAYYLPSVVEGALKDGKFTEYDTGKRTRVMKNDTAAVLREYLAAVITEGTGEDAKPETVTAAGKTATAQTGKYDDGVEISQGWFCGFFPAESPEYVVVVFSENTKKQIKSCNKIFAEIADNITSMIF